MLLVALCFYTLVVSRLVVCEMSTTAKTPSETNTAKQSVKIISSCDVGTTELNSDSSGNQHCLYQNASHDLCFYFGENNTTYAGASRECSDRGMMLASITKPHILDLLAGMINKQNASEDQNLFWVNVPNSSMGNWSIDYMQYYEDTTCDGKYKQDIEEKSCQFLMAKSGNTKLVLREMIEPEDCELKLKVFCQDYVLPVLNNTSSSSNTENKGNPTLAIIIATSFGVLVLLIIVSLMIRSLRKSGIHSHERMQSASKSDTSHNEEQENGNRYAVSKEPGRDTLNDKEGGEYADYAEVDDGVIDVDKDMNKTARAQACAQESEGDEPCYFVLNKETSVESLQHTYEDCAFKDVPAASTLPMRCNSLSLNRPAMGCTDETDENVYDWPDLLQPTNYNAKTRRTQSETEPQYFSLETEDTDETENIYDCVFPIDEPLKKTPKASRTKHLSLQRKKGKNKQSSHVKGQRSDGSRK